MNNSSDNSSNISLDNYGIFESKIRYNLSVKDLYEISISKNFGRLTDQGVLAINTGKFTGRSPKDRYIVKDNITVEKVWWGDINIAVQESVFDNLYKKIASHLCKKELYVRDAFACANNECKINIRTICEFFYFLLLDP